MCYCRVWAKHPNNWSFKIIAMAGSAKNHARLRVDETWIEMDLKRIFCTSTICQVSYSIWLCQTSFRISCADKWRIKYAVTQTKFWPSSDEIKSRQKHKRREETCQLSKWNKHSVTCFVLCTWLSSPVLVSAVPSEHVALKNVNFKEMM